MEKAFSTCLLVQKSSGTTELVTGDINLLSTSSSPPDYGGEVLLAGGFPSFARNESVPLSPTLHLNYVTGGHSATFLQRLAEAEVGRIEAVRYNSKTVAADTRVCVIGEDGDKLQTFIDTYGGLLEMQGILINGCHPEFATVREYNIERRDSGWQLTLQVFAPINEEKCTYCGDCAVVCPEKCISERLYLDASACTDCGLCEKACGVAAIDIRGGRLQSLEVPVIILLGATKPDLPEDTTNIYREDSLTEYFATLYDCRIDEVVRWQADSCQYSAQRDRGCTLCEESCRYGAITLDGRGVNVDHFRCEECGDCVAVCPTGALQNQRFSDRSFDEYLSRLQGLPAATVVIGSEQVLHQLWWRHQGKLSGELFFLAHENIKNLSLFHHLSLISRGARRIILLESGNGPEMERPAGRQVTLACALTESLLDLPQAVTYCHLDRFDPSQAPVTGSMLVSRPDFSFADRRQDLLHSLHHLVEMAGRNCRLPHDARHPFAEILCDKGGCTHCLACIGECRQGALVANEEEMAIYQTDGLCVGCGLCTAVCPENVLRLSRDCTIDQQFFQARQMVEVEPMDCKACGKTFGTRRSFERVMAILSRRETVNTEHFEYCDKCRVVQLFQAEQV